MRDEYAELCRTIFRRGSRTYYVSSAFFPLEVKRDVFTLYSFVRTADDFVDCVPQREADFYAFCAEYERAVDRGQSADPVIDGFVRLVDKRGFRTEWVYAFLRAMEQDLRQSSYDTLGDTLDYIYGSAEVVGLMMARILTLPDESLPAAQLLGRAMQYINFIRDIDEDSALGRVYFPRAELEKFGLRALDLQAAGREPEAFRDFLRAQIELYRSWQAGAEEGFRFIPRRYLIPIKTASEMYKWTGVQLHRDPMLVYRRKVKPSVARLLRSVAYNTIVLSGRREIVEQRAV